MSYPKPFGKQACKGIIVIPWMESFKPLDIFTCLLFIWIQTTLFREQGAGTRHPSDKALTDPTVYLKGFQLTSPSSYVGKP